MRPLASTRASSASRRASHSPSACSPRSATVAAHPGVQVRVHEHLYADLVTMRFWRVTPTLPWASTRSSGTARYSTSATRRWSSSSRTAILSSLGATGAPPSATCETVAGSCLGHRRILAVRGRLCAEGGFAPEAAIRTPRGWDARGSAASASAQLSCPSTPRRTRCWGGARARAAGQAPDRSFAAWSNEELARAFSDCARRHGPLVPEHLRSLSAPTESAPQAWDRREGAGEASRLASASSWSHRPARDRRAG